MRPRKGQRRGDCGCVGSSRSVRPRCYSRSSPCSPKFGVGSAIEEGGARCGCSVVSSCECACDGKPRSIQPHFAPILAPTPIITPLLGWWDGRGNATENATMGVCRVLVACDHRDMGWRGATIGVAKKSAPSLVSLSLIRRIFSQNMKPRSFGSILRFFLISKYAKKTPLVI